MEIEHVYGGYHRSVFNNCSPRLISIYRKVGWLKFRVCNMTTGRFREFEVVLLFTAFIASTYGFGVYLFPAMVESIRTDIPFSYGTMGTISSLVQAGFLVSALAAGFLTLRFGALPLILASIVLCAAGLAGLALADNVVTIAACLLLLGGSAAAIWVPMVEVSRDLISRSHQGKALGLMSSGTSYGVFVNSFMLTWILPVHGWRSLWVVTAAFVAVLAAVALIRLRGAGSRNAGQVETPVMAKRLLRQRFSALPKGLTAAILLMMFLNGLSCMPYQTYLSAFLQGEAGYTADTAAYVWRIIGLVGMFSGFIIGALADRITVRRGMIVTYTILALSCLALTQSAGGLNAALVFFAAVTFGISFYAIFGLVPAYISHIFGPGDAALVFAFGNIALGFGGMVGNFAGGWLKEQSGSFAPIYMTMLAAAVLSAVLSALMPNEKAYALTAEPAYE